MSEFHGTPEQIAHSQSHLESLSGAKITGGAGTKGLGSVSRRPIRRGGRRGFVHITEESYRQIEEYIRWSETVGSARNFNFGMSALVMLMAYTNLGIAQKMSAGPVDPMMRNAAAAWQIPVRRITERYFLGWKVRRIGGVTWELYNDSREAYYIEFGIHLSNARVRRPIRKLSLRKTLQFMEATEAYKRVWAEVYTAGNRRFGFYQKVQSPGMGTFGGPRLGARLP